LIPGAHIVLSGIELVLAGTFIGLVLAAPIGPVNVLVIQRAATGGFWAGLAAGIGAVLGDGTLAAVAAFSMRAVSELMVEYRAPIQLVGGAVLVIFGLGLLFAKPAPSLEPGKGSPRWEHTGVIPQTYFLTITNPGAILGTAAIFGGLGSLIGGLDNNFEALLLVAAVMGGSLLWWLGLSELIATIRHKLTEERLKLINRIAGMVLIAFGLLVLIGGLLREAGAL
jgi:threonine/homoserine/homoserine lactone efflux protein